MNKITDGDRQEVDDMTATLCGLIASCPNREALKQSLMDHALPLSALEEINGATESREGLDKALDIALRQVGVMTMVRYMTGLMTEGAKR